MHFLVWFGVVVPGYSFGSDILEEMYQHMYLRKIPILGIGVDPQYSLGVSLCTVSSLVIHGEI